MAEDLDNAEFWLPSEFLADDDIFAGKNSYLRLDGGRSGGKSFAGENGGGVYRWNSFASFGPNSDLSSPVESVVGSTETESDEEDYIAELTRRMARSTVHEDLWKVDSGFGYESKKSRGLSGSPQSTLCGGVGGCGCKQQGSSRGSPNCLSPPSAAAGAKTNAAAWDLLYAAAGEVARMRMAEEGVGYYQGRGLLGPPRKPSPISVPLKIHNPNINPNLNPNPGFHSSQSLSYHQLQAAQFQQLKQQQMMKQQSSVAWGQSKSVGLAPYQQNQTHQMAQNRATSSAVPAGGRPVGLAPCAWPTLQQSQQPQQQPGSGMRAVFLGNGASKRECAGTGVFLPRRGGTPTETRKKPGCSTVLLPDRVVQALNLNLGAMEAQPKLQPRCNGSLNPEYDAAMKYRNNVLMAQQRRSGVRPQPGMSNELRLPQEWTY